MSPNAVVRPYAALDRGVEARSGLGTFARDGAPMAQARVALVRSAARRFVDEARALGLPDRTAIAVPNEVPDLGGAR